jgi:hypothetical protein
MITKEQALTCNEFHENHWQGEKIVKWRRNGKTQTWKTRPDDFRVPVKYGLYQFGQITPIQAPEMHVAEDCARKDD